MSQKLPQVSGQAVLRLLQGLGYEVIRQRGSHVRLRKLTDAGEHKITVPVHKTVAKGTLSDILSRVSVWNAISKENVTERLRRK